MLKKILLLILSLMLFLTTQEVVLLDIFFSKEVKYLVNFLCLLAILFSVRYIIFIGILDLVFWLLVIVYIYIRFSYFGISKNSAVDLYHFLKFYLAFKVVVALIRQGNYENVSGAIKWSILLAFVSFVLFLIKPENLFVFEDHSGHTVYATYFSFSSSIYNLPGISFARMNSVFDEPGTFGLFISMVLFLDYYNRKKFDFTFLSIGVLGLSSMSLAYIIYFIGIIIIASVSKVRLRNFFIVAILFALFAFLLSFDSSFSEYIVGRFDSILNDSHNRSSGNELALEFLAQSWVGLSDTMFDKRLIPSSGIMVLAAYKGVLFVLPFVFSVLWLLVYFPKNKTIFFFLFLIVIATRNNFFTGFMLHILLFIIIWSYYIPNLRKK
ncbi:hypothetical protein EST55_04560 [Idiomarina sp. 29L]|uniref:hypothetical protein n=1 Tax=Idiomarina sp. 29L TaxID=2508877 RepID=UPI001011F606|nr:hypothetical protein [Idiomarina sp. 29L]RXS43028.1 hypothetical protein EST55_04560 [Idiomarina sp. 29L]